MKKSRRLREEKGFTLIELLVVMAILGVLAAMVFPTVTGMKTGGETASGKADSKEVENAVNAFNTNSRAQAFPEDAIAYSSGNLTINGKTVAISYLPSSITVSSIGTITPTSGAVVTTHTQISWTAPALVRQNDGTLKTLTLVPDFLGSKPKSATWVRGSSGAADEFIWLLKLGTASESQGRTLQVLRLNALGTAYEVVRE